MISEYYHHSCPESRRGDCETWQMTVVGHDGKNGYSMEDGKTGDQMSPVGMECGLVPCPESGRGAAVAVMGWLRSSLIRH